MGGYKHNRAKIETIGNSLGNGLQRSVRLLHHPRLSDVYYWHFHPEYELVYIQGTDGMRHVGNHYAPYVDGDLVLIGSYIPHLNFDYGVKGEYQKEVVHFRLAFVEDCIHQLPEFEHLRPLFERARYGVAFQGDTKKVVGAQMNELHLLSAFDQFMAILVILDRLSHSEEYELLHTMPANIVNSSKDRDRLSAIYQYVDEHYEHKISLDQIARYCHLTRSAFCRYFKKSTGNTFVHYLNEYRISQAKKLLLQNATVGEACFSVGFESLSYFNRIFARLNKMNPSQFKRFYHTEVLKSANQRN